MIPLEITSTELVRPEIISQSLASFKKHLRGVDWDKSILYVNIDPIPHGEDRQPVVDLLRQHFGTVIVNTPDTPSFPAALRWCWSQPINASFFSMELDWELTQDVEIDELQRQLRQPRKVCVNLRAYWHQKNRVCLSPCLLSTWWARRIAGDLVDDINPEHQLRPAGEQWPRGRGLQLPGEESMHFPAVGAAIRDIGREWLTSKNLVKASGDLVSY